MVLKADNYYEGFFRGWLYSSSMTRRGSIKDDLTNLSGRETLFVSRLFPVTAGHRITFSHVFDGKEVANDYAYRMASFYNENGGQVSGVGARTGYRNFNIPSDTGITQARFSNFITNLDDFYVYDVTAGEYIMKGKNVI